MSEGPRPVHILGIHDGHNCGATLTRNGRVLASVSEERLTRTKNEVGYPERSIDEVLRISGVGPRDLDDVAFASLFMHGREHLKNPSSWYRVGLDEQRADAERPKDYRKLIFKQRRQERIDAVRGHLGVAVERISFHEHHLCHLAAAYFTAPNGRPGGPVLGLTCDGAGDNLCATVSICRGNSIQRIAETSRHASLGKIYSRVTLLMGMTPWEHEYKVMGLAPYADPGRGNRAAEALRGLVRLSEDGLRFEQVGELSTNFCYKYLREAFESVRFDVIAAATQLFTEQLLTEWVRGCVAKTGIPDIVCGGGVFMNVKANMLVAQLPEVRSMYVMPSAGDESLSIGACLLRYYQLTDAVDHRESVFENLYLGGEFDGRDEERAIGRALSGSNIKVSEPNDVDDAIVTLLADGAIVARCRGRMEWGARALGNRSILARADDHHVVDRINRAIKQRDFWMPFAPSIREEGAGRYFADPKGLKPQYMTFAFPTADEGYPHLEASSHPRDRTIRPQLVTSAANPNYHRLLTLFERRAGRGAILNTSFNLHGYPIVNSPDDALAVFLNSELDHLALNRFLLSKADAAVRA